jgi:hypothetical protein
MARTVKPAERLVKKRSAAQKVSVKKRPVKRSAKRSAPPLSDALIRSLVAASEAAGSERVLAVEHAADRLNRYVRENRALFIATGSLLLAGTAKAPELILEADGTFLVRDVEGRRKAKLERVRPAEVVELWVVADLFDRIESALRTAAGLSTRPTGAVIAGLGVAGDRGAKV